MEKYHGGPWGKPDPVARFWSKVQKTDGCWLWTSPPATSGYGQFWIEGKNRGAHTVSYDWAYGPVPDGYCVLHRCDIKICVRPDHLFLGTRADNVADMVAKGRHATGDRTGARKHPERVPRGDRQGARLHPESRPRGPDHWMKHKPERVARGERAGAAVLTESLVLEILDRAANGESYASLGRAYGVDDTQISNIVHRRQWKHVIWPR